MRQKILFTLSKLREEYRKGENELATLASKQNHLEDMMLRISGAIQVLEELLEQENGESEESFHNLASESHEEEQPATADE